MRKFNIEFFSQRRDDNVPIFLTKPIKEIRDSFRERLEEMAKDAPKS